MCPLGRESFCSLMFLRLLLIPLEQLFEYYKMTELFVVEISIKDRKNFSKTPQGGSEMGQETRIERIRKSCRLFAGC